MILLRSFLSGHIRIKRTLEYYDAGIGPRVPFGGGFGPTVSANFAVALGDFTTLSSTSTMPTGGSISRAGNAMLYDVTGKLTYAPNNLVLQANTFDTSVGWYYGTSPGALSANTIVAPDGNTTASAYTWGTTVTDIGWLRFRPTGTFNASTALIYSIWVKVPTGTKTFRMNISDWLTTTSYSSNRQATTTWQRFSYAIPAGTLLNTGSIAAALFTALGSPADGIAAGDILHVWGPQLEAVTYQTSPSGTYYLNYPTPNTTSAYYGPRFDYDPVTLQPKGLLVEGTRTNLLTYSQDFRDTATAGSTRPWSNGGVVVSITGTSPDGSSNANLLTEDSSTGLHRIFQQQTVATGFYTISLYAKPNGRNWIFLYFDGGLAQAYINISTGAVGTTTGTSFRSASTQSVGNGWYRVSMTLNNTTSTGQNLIINLASADNTTSYAGNGTSGIYFYGVQLEAGGFATSYIPTVASTVARAAETFSLTGYANRLVEAYYIDEETGANFSGNSALSTGTVTISPPTFGWVTSLRAYQNAYAGSISSPSWLSFSRAGNAMYYDSTGTLTFAPANLLTDSNTFSATGSWTNNNLATPVQGATSWDGTNTAWTITNDGTNGLHRIYQGLAVNSDGIRSVYAKAGTANFMSLSASGTDGPVVNLIDGSITNAPTGGTAYAVSVGNGWWRVSWRPSGNVGFIQIFIGETASQAIPNTSYAGTGKSILIASAQHEPVTYQTAPSVYIPTTSAAEYGPRYDFDPSTVPATPRGLLIEEQRSNLIAYSQQFDNAAWIKSNGGSGSVPVVTANQATSPDGTPSADLSVFNAGSNGSGDTSTMEGPVFSASAQPYTFSLWMRTLDGSTKTVRISISGAGASNVTVTGVWQRFQTTWNASAGSWNPRINLGDGVTSASASLYIWGAQVEAGAFATSFIPTVATAPVTRAADVAQLTGSALTTLQGANASFVVEGYNIQANYGPLLGLPSGTLLQKYATDLDKIYAYTTDTNLYIATLTANALANTFRGALAYSASGTSVVGNNQTVVKSNFPPFSRASGVSIGSNGGNAPYAGGWFRSLAVYSTRLPDTILRQKSTVGAPY